MFMDRLIEGQNVELKDKIVNFRDISKTVCAFANTTGGQVYIGISDDGKVHGVEKAEIDSLQQRVEGAIQAVSPMPFHKIFVQKFDDKQVVTVEIYQLGQGTFCTFSGIVYCRFGSTNKKLEGKTLQDYMVTRHILFFDDLSSQAKIEDLEIGKIRDFLKIRTPTMQFEELKLADYLKSLGVLESDRTGHIKNAGVLFFAKNIAEFVPQNEIKLARFNGNQPVDIIDTSFINSTIPDNLRNAESFIKKNTKIGFRIKGLERREVPEYPTTVIREALVNAIAHRDYLSKDSIQINIFDDRIEFISPGTLPNGLTLSILGTLSIQRNPTAYRLMRDLGLIEGLGTGIPRMKKELSDAELPDPRFEELGNFFKVTIYNKSRIDFSDLNERQKRAIAYLEKNPSITSKKYASICEVSLPIAVSDLNKMCKAHLTKKVGKTRGAYYVRAQV